MEQQYFKTDAKQITDMLFNSKILVPDLTRDDLNGIEELLQYLMQSRFENHLKAEKLFEKINKHKP